MSSSIEWKDKPVKYLRDKVVEQLKFSYAQDHLETEEFEQLVKIALSTESKTELMSLIADLPQVSAGGSEQPEQVLVSDIEKGSMVCIFSGSVRKGPWISPKQLKILSIFGGAVVDYREARLEPKISKVSIGCCFGSVDIIVPPGVNVVSNAISIFGGVYNRIKGETSPDAPTIVIEGIVLFGSVTIKVLGPRKEGKLLDIFSFIRDRR